MGWYTCWLRLARMRASIEGPEGCWCRFPPLPATPLAGMSLSVAASRQSLGMVDWPGSLNDSPPCVQIG